MIPAFNLAVVSTPPDAHLLCGRCDQWKPATEFYPDPGKRANCSSWCRACHSARWADFTARRVRRRFVQLRMPVSAFRTHRYTIAEALDVAQEHLIWACSKNGQPAFEVLRSVGLDVGTRPKGTQRAALAAVWLGLPRTP